MFKWFSTEASALLGNEARSPSYIIIGAGVFGASSALHLSRRDPSARITLIDRTPFPCPKGASHDVNKIVRADYADLFYCRLGLESLDVWRSDQLYKSLFHESGMLSVYPSHGSDAETILRNFKQLNANPNAEVISPAVMKNRFDGLYAQACFDDVEHVLWNPHSGWAQAVEALTATIAAAVSNGVTYLPRAVAKLRLEQNKCTGVELEDGQVLSASRVLVCTGAGTAKLLADSAPHRPDLHVGDRFMAGGICEAVVKLTETQVEQYQGAATILFDANTTKGESMPPTNDGYLKFIRDIPFANTVDHAASGNKFSTVPLDPTTCEWTSPESIPEGLRQEVGLSIRGIYGEAAERELKPEKLRLCWDALAPDENWFITPHSRCEGLYLATAGTWHAWKFLPILGKYVVQMLYHELSDEMAQRWAWDRKIVDSPDDDVRPSRELKDIKPVAYGDTNGHVSENGQVKGTL